MSKRELSVKVYLSIVTAIVWQLLISYHGVGAVVKNLIDATKHLETYGYMQPMRANRIVDMATVTSSLRKYQSYMGLPVTGTLDDATTKMMNEPRCGFKDIDEATSNSSSRYKALSRWETKRLSYRIVNYPRGIQTREVDVTIQRAFDIWSKHTDLTFVPVTGTRDRAHISISFGRIDGPAGVLAYAYFPPGGTATFDSSETWTINDAYSDAYSGFNLLQVAAHEFGHSLGLDHSNVRDALMWPTYQTGPVALASDDIQGIQYLYGRKTTVNRPSPNFTIRPTAVTTQRPTVNKRPSPDLCRDGTIDAALSDGGGAVYFFRGSYYWKMAGYRPAPGYPKPIATNWPALTVDRVDAALHVDETDGAVYFFSGAMCWRYDRRRKLSMGYPKRIKEVFAGGFESDLDAAAPGNWLDDDYVYLFKGSNFWKYDLHTKLAVAQGNIIDLRTSLGQLPARFDALLPHPNGYTYVFVGDRYYRVEKTKAKFMSKIPNFSSDYYHIQLNNNDNAASYPRKTNKWWSDCYDTNGKVDDGYYGNGNEVDKYGGGFWPFFDVNK